ncbi:MAG: hypothetical protein QM733_22755 [Ilumatobacteraceae bacterium]
MQPSSRLAALSGCGSDGGGGAAATDDPDGFSFEAARRCTDVVNGIDLATMDAANDANLEVIEAIVRGRELSADDLPPIRDRLTASISVRATARDRLAELKPDGDRDAEAWAAIVAAVDAEIARSTDRAELLAGGNWDAIAAGYRPADSGGADDDLQRALEELRLAGRDCEIVATTRGIPADHATFVTSASSACTTIVSRRLNTGYSTDLVLGVVAQVLRNEQVVVSDELREQMDAVAAEWRLTRQDLQRVDTDGVPDDGLWRGVLDAAQERIDVFEARRRALQDGDAVEIERLFTPGEVWTHPGLMEDPAALFLDFRDCRSIQS